MLALGIGLGSGVDAVAASSNDNFSNAIPISGATGTLSGSNVGATTESGEPNLVARPGTDTGTGATLWYAWTSPLSGQMVFSTRGSQFDTTLAVLTGSSLTGLTAIGVNDDIDDFEAGGGENSQVTIAVVAGTTYRIQVGGDLSRNGTFQLSWGPPVALPSTPPESGWWYSPAEGGRGYSLGVSDGNLFMAAYMYRADGSAAWYVGTGALSGNTFTATFNEYGGGETLSGSYQAASLRGAAATATLVFKSTTTATLTWSGGSLSAPTAAIELTRYPFDGSSVQTPAFSPAPEAGWYWNASEGGTGYFIEMQGTQLFMAAYLYATDGSARWYVAGGAVVSSTNGLTFTPSLAEYAGGQTLGGSYRAPSLAAIQGQVTLQVSSSTSAVLTLPSGRQVALSRFTQF